MVLKSFLMCKVSQHTSLINILVSYRLIMLYGQQELRTRKSLDQYVF